MSGLNTYLVEFFKCALPGDSTPRNILPPKLYVAKSRDRVQYIAAKELVDSGFSYCLGEAMRRIHYITEEHHRRSEASAKGVEGPL